MGRDGDLELRIKMSRKIRTLRSEVDAGYASYDGWLRWRKARAIVHALEHLWSCYFGAPFQADRPQT